MVVSTKQEDCDVFRKHVKGNANPSVYREIGTLILHPKEEMLTPWDQSHGTDTSLNIPIFYCCKVPGRKGEVRVQIQKMPLRQMCLNPWSLAGSSSWESMEPLAHGA